MQAVPARFVRASGLAARTVALAAVVGLAFFGIGPHTGAYRTLTVLSGSMTPYFSPGDVIVVTPEPASALRVGQVIAYDAPVGDREPITHRVIAIRHAGAQPVIRTKGDADSTPDPWTARLTGSQVWRVRWVIPQAGWAIEWLRQPLARYSLTIGVPALLCLLWLRAIWSRPARRAAQESTHAADAA
jgi:signal peptidase I